MRAVILVILPRLASCNTCIWKSTSTYVFRICHRHQLVRVVRISKGRRNVERRGHIVDYVDLAICVQRERRSARIFVRGRHDSLFLCFFVPSFLSFFLGVFFGRCCRGFYRRSRGNEVATTWGREPARDQHLTHRSEIKTLFILQIHQEIHHRRRDPIRDCSRTDPGAAF